MGINPEPTILPPAAAAGGESSLSQPEPERWLVRHLAWIVVLKLLVLFALWHFFIQDHRPPVDPQRAADFIVPAPGQASPRTGETP